MRVSRARVSHVHDIVLVIHQINLGLLIHAKLLIRAKNN